MLIIEGPDGSGKSTLVKFLHELTGIPVHHSGGPPENREDLLDRTEYIRSNKGLIFDRFPPISEYVYGQLRNTLLFENEELCDIQDSFTGWILIYCRPPIETIKENLFAQFADRSHKSADHLSLVKFHIVQIISLYDSIMLSLAKLGNYLVIPYDYTRFGDFTSLIHHGGRSCVVSTLSSVKTET